MIKKVLTFYLLYLFFAFFNLNQALTYDELYWPVPAQHLAQGAAYDDRVDYFGEREWATPLYKTILSKVYVLWGVGNVQTKLIGVFGVLLQLFLIYSLALLLFEEEDNKKKHWLATITCLLYVTLPMVIQGSLLIYNDTSTIPILLLTFLYFFYKSSYKKCKIYLLMQIICVALLFWVKCTTVVPLIFVYLIYALLRRDKNIWLDFFLVSVLGFGLFVVTWGITAKILNLDFWYPMTYAIHASQARRTDGDILFLLLTVSRFVLWSGIFWSLILVQSLAKRLLNFYRKPRVSHNDFIFLLVCVLTLGYIVVGGAPFGLPRYHYPVYSLAVLYMVYVNKDAALVVAKIALDKWILCLSCFFLFVSLGDKVYFINTFLKKFMILGIETNFSIVSMLSVILLCILLVILFAPEVRAKAWRTVIATMFIVMLAENTSMNVLQAKADYSVGYCYGDKDIEKVLEFLESNYYFGQQIIAPNDILYYLKQKDLDLPYYTTAVWSKQNLENSIKEDMMDVLVFSIGKNSVDQYNNIFAADDFIQLLQLKYDEIEIGTFKIWTKQEV